MTPSSPATPRILADLRLRALGLALIAIAGAAIWWLAARAPTGVRQEADYLAATVAFLGISGGGMLASLGAHIHDPVRIAERWRPPA